MQKTVIFCLIFFLVFFSTGIYLIQNYGLANNSQDYFYHWNRINGINENKNYPGLFHFIFSAFSFNQYIFFGATISIFAFLIPYCLLKLAKSFFAVILYFCCFSLPYFLYYGATYPESLVLLFFLFYCLKRTPLRFFLLGGLASLTHNLGAVLFLLVLAVELFLLFFKEKTFFPIVFLRPETLNLTTLSHVFLFQLPFAIIIPGIKKIDCFSAIMIIASFIGATNNIRALSVAQLLLCVNAAKNIKDYSLKYQLILILFCLFQTIFFFAEYVFGTIRLFL